MDAGKTKERELLPGQIMAIVYQCFQCGHKWLPRTTERPALCPKCKSLRWDKPGKRGVKAEA